MSKNLWLFLPTYLPPLSVDHKYYACLWVTFSQNRGWSCRCSTELNLLDCKSDVFLLMIRLEGPLGIDMGHHHSRLTWLAVSSVSHEEKQDCPFCDQNDCANMLTMMMMTFLSWYLYSIMNAQNPRILFLTNKNKKERIKLFSCPYYCCYLQILFTAINAQ